MYTIGQFAKKTGLTIRALRFYDEKGLLKPASLTDGGQRLYNDDNLLTVQKIVTYKYLDFSIEEIHALLVEDLSIVESLKKQKEMLEEKRVHLNQIIETVNTAISLHEQTKMQDPTIFTLVLHSMLTKNEQRNYLEKLFPKHVVDYMFTVLEEDWIELNRRYIEKSYELKAAYRVGMPDDALRILILSYLNIMPQDLQLMIAKEATEGNIDDLDNWLFPSPFTKEEEAWLLEKVEQLHVLGEIFDEQQFT